MDQPFTFNDLDQLTEKSVTTLDDFHDIFINQSESLNHTYLVVDKNYEKIKTISSELNRLNYMNLQIQREIENTDIFMASVEERIMQLESCQHAISNKSNVDVNRENIYGLTENINCCLVNCKEEVELRQPHESLSFPNSVCLISI